MLYIGAVEWFFWEGVEMGLNARINRLDGEPELVFFSTNKTFKACSDSFKWGFCLGLVLTPEDYSDLTSWPEPDTIVPIEIVEKVENTIEIGHANFPVIGNC